MKKLFAAILSLISAPVLMAQIFSVTPSMTETSTPTDTATATATWTETATPTASPTSTASPTASPTSTITPTATPTATRTHTYVSQSGWGSTKDIKQIQNEAFNDSTQRWKVEGSMSMSAPVTAVTTGGDEIANEATLSALSAKVTEANTGSVTIASSALPAGAATEATSAAIETIVDAILNSINAQKNAWGFEKRVLVDTGGTNELEIISSSFGTGVMVYGADSTKARAPLLQDSSDRLVVNVDYKNPLDGTEWTVVKNFSAAQTNALVKVCPAGKKLVITGVFVSCDGTVNLDFQDEDDTPVFNTIYMNGVGSGSVQPGPKDAPWAILGTDKDLEVDTSAAVNHGFTVKGYISQ